MCDYFCIGFIDLMFDNKRLIEFTSLFSPSNLKENDRTMKYYFEYF